MTVIECLAIWTALLGLVCLFFILRKETKAFKGLSFLVDATCIAWVLNFIMLIFMGIRGG